MKDAVREAGITKRSNLSSQPKPSTSHRFQASPRRCMGSSILFCCQLDIAPVDIQRTIPSFDPLAANPYGLTYEIALGLASNGEATGNLGLFLIGEAHSDSLPPCAWLQFLIGAAGLSPGPLSMSAPDHAAT